MALLDLLGRRWALRVLWELRDGEALTFRELQARCGGVSSTTGCANCVTPRSSPPSRRPAGIG
jgi:hypothetical protein